MSTSVYLTTILLVLGTIVLLAGLRYLGLSRRAAAHGDHEEAYRRLAAEAAQSQSQAAVALTALRAAVAETNARLAAVETLLKEVG